MKCFSVFLVSALLGAALLTSGPAAAFRNSSHGRSPARGWDGGNYAGWNTGVERIGGRGHWGRSRWLDPWYGRYGWRGWSPAFGGVGMTVDSELGWGWGYPYWAYYGLGGYPYYFAYDYVHPSPDPYGRPRILPRASPLP